MITGAVISFLSMVFGLLVGLVLGVAIRQPNRTVSHLEVTESGVIE